MSLPREIRLRKSHQFNLVRKNGVSRTGRLLIVACLFPEKRLAEAPERPLGPAQCGFTLTRKLGNAVARNLTRRRLREITREAQPHFPPGSWVVTIPKRPGMTADFATLRSEWRYLARKLGILPPKLPKPLDSNDATADVRHPA